jgi:hypothetical protein
MKKTLILSAVLILFIGGMASANIVAWNGYVAPEYQPGSVSYNYFTIDMADTVTMQTSDEEFYPMIWVFHDDGDLTIDDAIDYGFDSGTGFSSPPGSQFSTWVHVDSDFALEAGDYFVAVGAFWLNAEEDVLVGVNTLNDPLNPGEAGNGFGNYTLTLSAPNATITPIPASIFLFGTGLMGLIFVSRKNKINFMKG